jgi:hypothetical protein
MNSRDKGKRGERWWRDVLRAEGYTARRGQQFCGSPDSPDVICAELDWIHFEVKAVEKLNIWDAMDQARRDCGSKVPIVVQRRNFRGGLLVMEFPTFFKIIRGDIPVPEVFRESRNTTGESPVPPMTKNFGPDRTGPCKQTENTTTQAAVDAPQQQTERQTS